MATITHQHHLNLPTPLQVELLDKTVKPTAWKRFFNGLGRWILNLVNMGIPIAAALYGYNLVNKYQQDRDQDNRLKTARVAASIQAFDSLSRAYILNRQHGFGQSQMQFAFAKIQLFGDSSQIRMINELVDAKPKDLFLQPIFQSIKNSLRRDLGMPEDTSRTFVTMDEAFETPASRLPPGLWTRCPVTNKFVPVPGSVSMFNDKHIELIGNTAYTEIHCPACGQVHTLFKKDIFAVN